MIVSRMASLALRVAQFVCAAIVLGLCAYFLHQRDEHGLGPLGRTIYAEIIAALSVIFSLIWMIPTTSSIINYATDLFFSAAWFAAFGALVDWYYDINCGSIWSWGGIEFRGNYCGKWNAAEAFSFLAAIFWFRASSWELSCTTAFYASPPRPLVHTIAAVGAVLASNQSR